MAKFASATTPAAGTLSYVRCAVSMRQSTLIEALEIMDRPDDDPGTERMRTEIEALTWVLGLIDGKVDR